jgi:hypothetical protein
MSARGAYTIADLLFVVLDTTFQTLTSTRIRIRVVKFLQWTLNLATFAWGFRITMI